MRKTLYLETEVTKFEVVVLNRLGFKLAPNRQKEGIKIKLQHFDNPFALQILLVFLGFSQAVKRWPKRGNQVNLNKRTK